MTTQVKGKAPTKTKSEEISVNPKQDDGSAVFVDPNTKKPIEGEVQETPIEKEEIPNSNTYNRQQEYCQCYKAYNLCCANSHLFLIEKFWFMKLH